MRFAVLFRFSRYEEMVFLDCSGRESRSPLDAQMMSLEAALDEVRKAAGVLGFLTWPEGEGPPFLEVQSDAPLLSMEEAAKRLGITTAGLRKRVRKRRVLTARRGKFLFFTQESLELLR